MSIKLSFEASESGFSKVTKALQDSQRLIDDNAKATESLNKARQGLGRTDTEFKSSENLKTTSNNIKDLVGAFDSLTKSQSGLQGFIGLFGTFNKQLMDFNKSASQDILKGMQSQMEILKRQIEETTGALSRARKEATEHRQAGRMTQALESEKQAAEFGGQAVQSQQMLRGLRSQYMARAPIGTLLSGAGGEGGPMAGLAGMGPSLGGIIGGAGVDFTGVMGAAYMASKIGNIGLNAYYSGQRGEIGTFNREVQMAQEAEQGQGARLFLQNHGIGIESAYAQGTRSNGVRALEGAAALGKYITNFGQKSWEEIDNENREKYTKLDEIRKFSLNKGLDFGSKLAADPNFYRAERTMGEKGLVDLLKSSQQSQFGLRDSGLTAEQFNRLLSSIQLYQGNAANRTNGPLVGGVSGLLSNNPYDRAGFLERSQRAYGVSDDVTRQLQQQRFYRTNAGSELAQTVGLIGSQNNLQVQNMLLDEAYTISNAGLPFKGGSAAEVVNPMATTFNNIGGNVDAATKAQAAIGASQFTRGKIGKYGSFQSRAVQTAIMKMGIVNPVQIQSLMQLITNGQQDQAAKVISDITGKDINEVKSNIEDPVKATMGIASQLIQANTLAPGMKMTFEQASQKEFGVSAGSIAMAGFTPTAIGLDASKNNPVFGVPRKPGQLVEAKPLQAASLDTLTTLQAEQEGNITRAMQDISKTLGTTFLRAVTQTVADGFRDMGEKIKHSAGVVANELGGGKEATEGKKPKDINPFQGVGEMMTPKRLK